MAKITLTDEEKIKLLDAVNAGVEPSPDLLQKIFPGTAEKFDIKALDRAKIPTLEYAGKRSKAAILTEAGAGIGAAPLQVVRTFGKVKGDDWQNLIVQGDNLQFLKTCYRNEDPLIKDKVKGRVKLIYIDPPFATKGDFGGTDGEYSYSDKIDRAVFLETLRERLIYLREILSNEGSIFVHLDSKMSHYVKVVMDEVFGKDNYLNEIIWMKTKPKSSTSTGKIHDTLHWYSKNKNTADINTIWMDQDAEYIEKTYKYEDAGGKFGWVTLDAPGQGESRTFGIANIAPPTGRHWAWTQERINEEFKKKNIKIGAKGAVYQKRYLNKTQGQVVGSLWIDPEVRIGLMNSSNEYVGYPTQKPERLLNRIIQAATTPGDIVIDCFAGSGTTLAVAEKLGRNWVGCDFGKHSVYTIQKRIINISESKKLGVKNITNGTTCEECESVIKEDSSHEKCTKCGSIFEIDEKQISEKYNHSPKPFSVVSAGAYDFSRVMALGNPEHKDTYIAFVLGLFLLGRDEDKAKRFKLTNIYADKAGAPVEVYPVWDEHYLKDVRIDEEYLKSIIAQAGGRLRGEYYIITPEHCTNIGETTLKNSEGKAVNFKFLTFPYKVLEDAARHLELHDQPSSQGAVNELITSTAFYFNEDVKIEVKRVRGGLQLTKFDTKILDKSGNRFSGLNGLAMLLVDIGHETESPFDMDATVFAKDIDEEGNFSIGDIARKSLAVIAIDKHGNESKPFVVK